MCGVTGRIAVEANMGAISAVMQYGSEAQKRLAAELVLGGDKPAICITEPDAGSAATEMTTRADRRGGHYIINGRKHWITGGGVSRLHLIFARVFDRGRHASAASAGSLQCAMAAPRACHRHARTRPWACAASRKPRSSSQDLEVPRRDGAANPGRLKRGFAELMEAYNSQRVGAATVALGLAQGAFEAAIAFARTATSSAARSGSSRACNGCWPTWRSGSNAARLVIHRAAASADAVAGPAAGGRRQRCSPRRWRSGSPTTRCRCSARAATRGTIRWSAWRATRGCSPSAAGRRRCCATSIAGRLLGWKLPQHRGGFLDRS